MTGRMKNIYRFFVTAWKMRGKLAFRQRDKHGNVLMLSEDGEIHVIFFNYQYLPASLQEIVTVEEISNIKNAHSLTKKEREEKERQKEIEETRRNLEYTRKREEELERTLETLEMIGEDVA